MSAFSWEKETKGVDLGGGDIGKNLEGFGREETIIKIYYI